MDQRVIWIGAIVGSVLGGYLPNLWDESSLSWWGLLFSTLGGLGGIWLAARLTR